MRKSRFAVIFEAIGGFFLPNSIEVSKAMPSPPWFAPSFVRRNRAALCGYVSRVRLFGSLPSFQDNLASLEYLRRLLGTWTLHPELLREVRFPYLDRDLLEFLFALPREQVVGVGQRRSLMKRALVGIVPDELLKRRRKAFVSQESQKDDSAEWARLVEMSHELVANGWGIIDSGRFVEALQKAVWNEETATGSLIRTVMMLAWLRHLSMREVLTGPMCRKRRTYGLGQAAEKPRLLAQSKSSAS